MNNGKMLCCAIKSVSLYTPPVSLSLSHLLSFILSIFLTRKMNFFMLPQTCLCWYYTYGSFQEVSDPPTIRFSFPAGSSPSSEPLQGFGPAGGLCQEVPGRLPQGHPLHAPQSHPGHRHGNPFQLSR